jgi:hypothetical protein
MFTGNVARQDVTTVKVSPNVISAGDYVNVNINPGIRCAEKTIKIYKEGRTPVRAIFDRKQTGPLSGYRYCTPYVASYKSKSIWEPGSYYVLVKDVATNTNIKASFTIE